MKTLKERVSEHSQKLGIEWGLLDLDDFLLYTERLFLRQIALAAFTISNFVPSASAREIRTSIAEFSLAAFKEPGVSVRPDRWERFVLPKVADRHHVPPYARILATYTMQEVYTEKPQLRKGALLMLNTLQQPNLKLAVVSHAVEDWTYWKARVTGIRQRVDEIIAISPDGGKTAEEWNNVICNRLNTRPEKVFVAGDNIQSDIRNSHKAGVRRLIWLNGSECPVYGQQGQPPEGTKRITTLSHLIPAILSFED